MVGCLHDGELIGDCGLAYGAAAGIELDRYDLSLGTPPHTKIIASSGGHSDNYILVTEELLYAYAGLVGSLDYRIRGDVTYSPLGTTAQYSRPVRLLLDNLYQLIILTIVHPKCWQMWLMLTCPPKFPSR